MFTQTAQEWVHVEEGLGTTALEDLMFAVLPGARARGLLSPTRAASRACYRQVRLAQISNLTFDMSNIPE